MTPHPDLAMHEVFKIVEYILQLQPLASVKKLQQHTHTAKPVKPQAGTAAMKEDTVPGDRFPLQSVHPAFTLEQVQPSGFMPRVAAMDFLPDVRLLGRAWRTGNRIY